MKRKQELAEYPGSLIGVHLFVDRNLSYLVIRPLEEIIPSHEHQNNGAKTIWGPAKREVESFAPQVSIESYFGTCQSMWYLNQTQYFRLEDFYFRY